VKQLNLEESLKVLDALDVIIVTCGSDPIVPKIKTIENELPIKDEAFWNLIYKDIATSIGTAFVQLEAELNNYINNPVKQAELKARLKGEEPNERRDN
jgi:hypothetical protein